MSSAHERLASGWRTWVRMWDLTEHPRSLALVRVSIGLVMLWDLGQVARLQLIGPLMGLAGSAGFSATLSMPHPAPVASLFGQVSGAPYLLYAALLGTTLLYTVGVLTRPAMVLFVALSAQWEWMLPGSSRGIESMIRIVLLILAFSRSADWLSVSAWWRTGSLWGDGQTVPAWPRHLIICQLVLMYFLAGVQKFGLDWSPAHGFSALFLILQDPAIANAPYGWVASQPWYAVSQLGTALTLAWEWSTPVLLLAYWYRFTSERPGRVRAFFNRWQVHWWWAMVGVVFHLGIAATLELGIFPSAMLAFYFSLVHPDELRQIARRP